MRTTPRRWTYWRARTRAIERDDLPTPAVVRAESNRHESAREQGRAGDDLPFVPRVVSDVHIPDERSSLLVERDYTRVGQAHEDETCAKRHAFAEIKRNGYRGKLSLVVYGE